MGSCRLVSVRRSSSLWPDERGASMKLVERSSAAMSLAIHVYISLPCCLLLSVFQWDEHQVSIGYVCSTAPMPGGRS